MEVCYRLRPRDTRANFIHEFSRPLKGKLLFVAWLLIPLISAGAWQGGSHAALTLAGLKGACIKASFLWLMSAVGPFVVTLFLPARVLVISASGLAFRAANGDEETLLLWKRISAVEEDGHYIRFLRFWYSFGVPKDAFASGDEADKFFQTALTYWREARGVTPSIAEDAAGVWPPAPLGPDG